MKVAVSTVCMTRLPWEKTFEQAAKAGFRHVELLAIPGWKHVTPGQEKPADIRKGAKRAGVELIGIHAGGINGASDEKLASSTDYILKCIAFASELEVGLLVFTGHPTPTEKDAPSREAIRDRIVRGLDGLESRLAASRVRVGLENHYRCQVETADDYRAILGQTSARSVGITLDTGHFTASGIDAAAIAREFGPRVIHVHVKDHIGPKSVGLGRGQTNNEAVVRELVRHGFDGYLSAEIEAEDHENALQYVREAKPYLDRLVGLAGKGDA